MAVQAIGGVSSTAYTAPTSATAPADPARRGGPESKDSTIGGRVTAVDILA
jgi:hypothetical protein